MTRFIALGLAAVLGIAGLNPAVASAADIALVVGNHDYRKAPDAVDAEVDARDVAAALEEGGYEVILGINLDRREMRRVLAQFDRRIDQAERVVVFFSGHALRSEGVTYLAPVDQDNDSLVEVMLDGVPIDLVLRLAQRKPGGAVVFVDAAQLDGFRPKRFAEPGLADIDPGSRLLVVSAAAPGRAIRRRGGDDGSRFARQVVRRFLEPGARVSDAVRRLREPAWVAGAADPGLVLVPHGRRQVAGGTGTSGRTDVEIEDALALTRAERREIQESLSLLGHDPRGIDGVFGPGTRTAVRLWQRANNLTQTGYLTGEQVALLRDQARRAGRPGYGGDAARDRDYWARTGALGTGDGYRAYLERYSDGLHAAESRAALKRMAERGTDFAAVQEYRIWRDIQRSDRAVDYREYLQRYPSGIWKPEAQARLAALEGSRGPAPQDPAAAEAALGLTRTDRLSIEQRLGYLGFSPGAQDGFFDSATRWAIEGYQRSRGYETTGYLDRTTVAGIMNETEGARTGIVGGAAILLDILRGAGQ